MISVITVTNRDRKALEIIQKALRRQTHEDFEWIIGSPTKPDYLTIPYKWVQDRPKQEGEYWTVYSAYNGCLRVAEGELIVSIQDNAFFDPSGLEKFWTHYELDNKVIVSGVGNKYSDDTFSVMTWKDPRERDDQGSFYKCYHNDIEWNYCAVPKKAIYDVGGFDEEMNKYSSLCGLDVLDRLNIVGGWEFYLDQTNKSYSLEHPRYDNWEENLPFKKAYPDRLKQYKVNPVLEYLK